MSRRPIYVFLVLLLLVLPLTQACMSKAEKVVSSEGPNILFILTDDQDERSLSGMPTTRALLADEGVSFTNAFATVPSCCPSRVSYMRGQYAHNHGVLTGDSGAEGGFEEFRARGLDSETVATHLDSAGYSTFYAGKYLNGYRKNDTYVAPGFDRWFAFAGGVKESYTANENGVLRRYTQQEQHETYYLREKAEDFIRSQANTPRPWFAWVSTHAPHVPHTTAPEFEGDYAGKQMPRDPSYNEADVSDKPPWIQSRPLLDDDCSQSNDVFDCNRQIEAEWRNKQETLLSVDNMVGALVAVLADTGQLERTYIVFSSDNGYSLYNHRYYGKGAAYEDSAGVPLIVRGPGVKEGVVRDELVGNIDFAPTVLDWAGLEAPGYVDGRSLNPLLTGENPGWRTALLLEHFGHEDSIGGSYAAVRTERYTYIEYETGEEELYDLEADPYELKSIHTSADPELLGRLRARLDELKDCAGADCREAEGP